MAIDDARRFDTDLSHQSGTSVPMAPHAIQAVIDKVTRDAAQIVLILHREPRPVARVRATGPARITSPNLERRVGSLWRHTVYREPQLGGAVTLDQRSGLRRQDAFAVASYWQLALQELRPRLQRGLGIAQYHPVIRPMSENGSWLCENALEGSPADRDCAEFPRLDHFEHFFQ